MNGKVLIATACAWIGIASIEGKTKNEIAQRINLELGMKVSEDLILNVRSSAFMENHLEQFQQVEYKWAYDSTGSSGMDYAIGGKLLLGNFGKATISCVGEVAVYNRDILDIGLEDSTNTTPPVAIITPSKLRVYTPSSGVNIHIPVANFLELEMNNAFRRTIAVRPQTLTHWIWAPQILGRTVPLTKLNLSPYIYYQGFDNKDERYIASYSFGLTAEPIAGLVVDIADRVFWNPDPKIDLSLQRIHQIYLSLGYTFDFTKK